MDMSIISIIVALIVMEGLLSFDNGMVLATMVNKLKDPAEQKKALYYGMVGAVGFRILFIALGVFLINLWWLKVLGGAYLLKLAYDHFFKNEDEDHDGVNDKFQDTLLHKVFRKFGVHLTAFWSVVISVELMDLAFSIDSILAALALSDKFWVLLLGGVLGIAMMRFAASIFIKLMAKVPEMEHTAYLLIVLIAGKLLISTVHNFAALAGFEMHEIHVSHTLFFALLATTFIGTFIVHKINVKRGKHNVTA